MTDEHSVLSEFAMVSLVMVIVAIGSFVGAELIVEVHPLVGIAWGFLVLIPLAYIRSRGEPTSGVIR